MVMRDKHVWADPYPMDNNVEVYVRYKDIEKQNGTSNESEIIYKCIWITIDLLKKHILQYNVLVP